MLNHSDHKLPSMLLFLAIVLIDGCSSPGNTLSLQSRAINFTSTETEASITQGAKSRLESVPCWFDIPDDVPLTSCYRMYVPENHQRAKNTLINFPVVKLAASNSSSKRIPVLHLGGGGPGNPIGFDPDSAELWLWNWYQEMSVDDDRDLYLIDPRGVGMAEPVLVCKEYIPAFLGSISRNLTSEEEISWNNVVNQACANRLTKAGVELGTYNSLSIAKDMELLRQQLNIEKWHLYGVSYGSRYALTMAREFPDTVESMILDAAVFPNIRYMENYAANLEQAFSRLINVCNDSKNCSNTLGNPEKRFWNLARQLSRSPIRTTINHPLKEQKINLVLNGERFLSVYYNALYDAEQFKDLPDVITTLEDNELGVFEQKINDWLGFQTDQDYGDASAAAHYCYEESPFIDYDQAIQQATQMRSELRGPTIALLQFNQRQCEIWPVLPAAAIEGAPVVTMIPTLFLHGSLDPVLPVENLEAQLNNFANATYEIFPEVSHSIVGVHPCGESMAKAFYNYQLDFRTYVNCMVMPE